MRSVFPANIIPSRLGQTPPLTAETDVATLSFKSSIMYGTRPVSMSIVCDLITSHTARRTGATNLFKLGFSPLEIMKITGHTSEKTFLKYIEMSKIENADRMAEKIKKME